MDIDVIKRGYLKYKTSVSPGYSSQAQQGNQIKTFREFWFVFRVRKDVPKTLEYYANEKDFIKRSNPKSTINLNEVQAVHKSGHDKPKQLILTAASGILHVLETSSVYEANLWLTALNAVLFGRGSDGGNVVTFFVDVWDSDKLSYAGPGILELNETEIIVWKQDKQGQVVVWQLRHIRMFKAKQDHFQVMTGSRSSTGEGIFQFGTQDSVLITNTLGTIIEMLSDRKRQGRTQNNSSTRVPSRSRSEKSIARPPLPVPYDNSSQYSSLSRGLTSSQAAIPGFTDVPGHRGPPQSSQVYSRLSYVEQPLDSNSSRVQPGRTGRPHQPPMTASPFDDDEYSHITINPNPPQRGFNPKELLHGNSVSPSDESYSRLATPGRNPNLPRSQSHQPMPTHFNDIAPIYSDIDDNNYAEVDQHTPSPALPPLPQPPLPSAYPRQSPNDDYSEVEGTDIVPQPVDDNSYSTLHSVVEGQKRSTNQSTDKRSYSKLSADSTYSTLKPVEPSGLKGTFNPYNSMILMDEDIESTYSTLSSTSMDISDRYEVSPLMQRKAIPTPPATVDKTTTSVPIRTTPLPVTCTTPEELAAEDFEPEDSSDSFYSEFTVPSPVPPAHKPLCQTTSITSDPDAPPVPPHRGAAVPTHNRSGPTPPVLPKPSIPPKPAPRKKL